LQNVKEIYGALLSTAPSGARHSARTCVEALEKGVTIPCELRLGMNQMTISHSHTLNVTLHLTEGGEVVSKVKKSGGKVAGK